MALAALGLTEAPVHEPVHGHHSERLMSTTERYHTPREIRLMGGFALGAGHGAGSAEMGIRCADGWWPTQTSPASPRVRSGPGPRSPASAVCSPVLFAGGRTWRRRRRHACATTGLRRSTGRMLPQGRLGVGGSERLALGQEIRATGSRNVNGSSRSTPRRRAQTRSPPGTCAAHRRAQRRGQRRTRPRRTSRSRPANGAGHRPGRGRLPLPPLPRPRRVMAAHRTAPEDHRPARRNSATKLDIRALPSFDP